MTPRFYSEDPSPLLGSLDSAMDRFWIHAANYALEHKMPVLWSSAVDCSQNAAFGGSLFQDLSYKNQDHMLHSQKQNRDYLIHQVTMDADSHLAYFRCRTGVYQHHASPVRKEPGKGLKITAHTADGILKQWKQMADSLSSMVQWHPGELAKTVNHNAWLI